MALGNDCAYVNRISMRFNYVQLTGLDLSPEALSFITRVCGFGFYILTDCDTKTRLYPIDQFAAIILFRYF